MPHKRQSQPDKTASFNCSHPSSQPSAQSERGSSPEDGTAGGSASMLLEYSDEEEDEEEEDDDDEV